MGRCRPLGSLNSFLSYAPQLSGASAVSLFTLLLRILPAPQQSEEGGSFQWIEVFFWIEVLRALIHVWQIEGEKLKAVTDFLFLGSKNHCGRWLQSWNQKTIASWQENHDKLSQCVEKQRDSSADKSPCSQDYGFPSGHIQLCELDCKEGRTPKNWCLWTVVMEKTPESPLDSKIKPDNLKGDQPWMFTGRTDAEAKAPVFWSSDVNRWLIGKIPDAGKEWRQKENRASGVEMAGRHHRCNERKLGQTPGDGEGQGGPACCSPWGHKESDPTGWLNNNKFAFDGCDISCLLIWQEIFSFHTLNIHLKWVTVIFKNCTPAMGKGI